MANLSSEHPREVPFETPLSQEENLSAVQPFLTRFIEPQEMAGGSQTYTISEGGKQDIKWDPD